MNKFQFNPPNGLLDTNSYPTNPSTEAEARGQIQDPLNQLKDFLNLLVGGFESSVANNGFTKLPNGFLIQMGTATVVNGVNGLQINFPIQFETNNFKVIPSVADSNKGTSPVQVWVTGKNKTNFYARTSEGNTIIDWIAIGK